MKRTVLVTGAGGGIGAAICKRLASPDTNLVLCDVAETDALKAADTAARENGSNTKALTGDLSDPDVPEQLVRAAVEEFGGLDGIVSNAGIAGMGWLDEVSLEDWDRLFSINLRSSWLLARAGFPHLRESRGTFIATGSVSGMAPQAGMGLYNITKSAIIMMCQTLAQEWGQYGIRVNCVSPGFVRSPLTEATYADPEKHAARVALVPYGRIGTPEDIANGYAWLLSNDADYVTGHNLVIDGAFAGTVNRQIGAPPRKS